MARSNQKVSACMAAATGLTNREAAALGEAADAYNTGDITADYAAAAADLITEAKDKLAAIQKALAEKNPQMSDARQNRAGESKGEKHTVESLLDALKKFMRTDALGHKVIVVDTFADLKEHLTRDEYVSLVADVIRGAKPVAFAMDGKAYFIADRVAKGKEKGIFLHEVGGHLGLQRLLPDGKFQQLHDKIVKWAKTDDGSSAHLIAKLAMDRAEAAGTDPDQLANEHVAYFIEEAVNNGIDPVAVQASDYPLHEWVRTIWAAFKGALRRLGFNTDTLTAEDVVDLAYGAARLEIKGAWHGTAAQFRKFDHKFMGTGEGAQAYGWGTYLAQLAGIAKGYWTAEVKKKTGLTFGGQPIRKAYKAAYERSDDAAELALGELVRFVRDKQWKNAGADNLVEMAVDELRDRGYNEAADWLLSNAAKVQDSAPDGSLMRVDFNVADDEWLDWNKPLTEQSPKVQKALRGAKGLKGYSPGGPIRQYYANLAAELGGDKAASEYLDSIGVKGVKFEDAQSRDKVLTIDGKPYSIDDIKALRNTTHPLAEHEVTLRSLLRDGVAKVRAKLEQGVQGHAKMFLEISEDSAARYNVPFDKAKETAKAEKSASQTYEGQELAWLNSMAGKIKVGQPDATYNHVIFNDKNIIRVGSLIGADRQRTQFSKIADKLGQKFWDWFGDSKIVDENGEPLVVYHGTDGEDFDVFAPDENHLDREDGRKRRYVDYLGRVIYFSPSRQEASAFATNEKGGDGARVIPAYLRMEKPFDMRPSSSMPRDEKKALFAAAEKLLPGDATLDFWKGILGSVSPREIWERVADVTGHADKANEMLKSLGYDGMISDTGDMGVQYAVFGSDQIKSAIGNNGQYSRSDKRIQYSKAMAADADNTDKLRSQLVEQIRARMSPQAKDKWESIRDFFDKHFPWLLTNYQLADQYGGKVDKNGKVIEQKGVLTTLRDYVKQAETMRQKRNAQTIEANKISEEWDKLRRDNPAMDKALSDVMLQATLKGIHPDLKFDHEGNKHLDPSMRAEYDKLAAKYNALSPAAKDMYQKVKTALADDWKKRQAAYHGLVDYTYSKRMAAAMGDKQAEDRIREEMNQALLDYDRQIKQISKGPYFPLMRFGEYLAIGESSQLLAVKKQLEAATGEERATLQKQLDAMKKDPNHYEVSAHESKGDRRKAMRAMEEKFGKDNVRTDLTDQYIDGMQAISQVSMNHIMEVIDADFDGKIASDLNTSIASIFLRSLPEMHALRREAQRKGIAGASPDMLRAFSAASQQNAFYTSRLEHASEMADTMFRMKAEAKGNDKLSHIFREMQQRMALDMRYTKTPIQDMIGSASWVYHLGLSPSFMMINATQPWLVTGPVLAGKFGAGAATKALARGTQDALRVLKAARWKDGKWDAWSGIDHESLKDKEDRTAIRALMERGILDEGQQHELNMYAEDSSRWLSKVNRHMGWATQQIEISNRLGSALAAFRLARRNMDYDAALEYAYKTTLNTQFDYSQEGTARFMREGGGVPLAKLVFQFRRYQQSMLYLLGDNIKKSFGSGQEAKEARGTLAYLTLTSGLSAGVMGLPFLGVGLALANMFRDPDDPEGDAETKLRNALFHMTGDRETATVLAKGIPAMFGADVSKRIGLGDIASPLPMLKFQGRTGQEKAGELLVNMLGPAGGLAARAFDGYTRMTEGDWAKGLEKLAPKVLADVSKAVRYGAGEGLTDGQGTPTGADIGGWDVFLKSLGIAPTVESNYYEGTTAIKNVQAAVKSRLGRIGNAYEAGLRKGDMADVRAMIAEFNADHPENPITPKQEMEWRKQAREANKNRTPETGIKLGTKRNATYNDVGAFAL